MPITVRLAPPSVAGQFEIACEDTTEVWEILAKFQELFGVSVCGCCGKDNIAPRVRVSKDQNRYYGWECQQPDCGAELTFHEYNPKTSGKKGLYRKWDDEWKIFQRGGGDGDEKPAERQLPI